jgi:hypothetical protein
MARKGAPGNFEGWYGILGACRKLGKDGCFFTAQNLADAMKFQAADATTPTQMASAWLGKFAKWGYVERGEPDKTQIGLSGGRPPSTYRMSDLGNECEERPGRLTRLLNHIRALGKARGSPQESQLYNDLFPLADRIEKNAENER